MSEDIQFFSGLGTRATGYSGNWLAAQYIYDQFESYGLDNLTLQELDVVDCIDHGTNVTFLSTSETIELYSMRPNYVVPSTTPPEGISGTLIYVNDGDPEDFEGKAIQDKIVLLDWKAGSKWTEVYKRGAKAVIFLNPDVLNEVLPVVKHDTWDTRHVLTTTYIECLPLKFPRFYAPDSARDALFSHLGEEVLLKSSTYWEKVKTWNIFGVIEGTEWPDQSILVVAHYDSYSDAPGYAPGAQEACNIASLLELMRYFQSHKPKHTVIFLAVGGHHQAQEGTVQFIDEFLNPTLSDLGWFINKNILWIFDLQFDTGSDEMIWLPSVGGGRGGRNTIFWRGEVQVYRNMWSLEIFIESAYNDINTVKPLGKTYSEWVFDVDFGASRNPDMGTHFSWFTKIYDSEPYYLFREGFFTQPTFPIATIFTTAYYNKFLYHPFDEFSYLNLQNLQTQVELTFSTIDQFVNVDWTTDLQDDAAHTMMRSWVQNRDTNVQNWISSLSRGAPVSHSESNATGTVAAWNEAIGWYTEVPGALVVIEGGAGQQSYMTAPDPRRFSAGCPLWYRRMTFADENGRYVFKGGMTPQDRSIVAYMISAWVINSSNGDLTYAPEQGIREYGQPNYLAYQDQMPEFGILAVFECSQLVMDIYHPNSLSIPTLASGDRRPPDLGLNNEKFEPIDSYGRWGRDDLYVVAVPPNEGVKVLVTSVLERYPFLMFLNSTQQNPGGSGFTLKTGEQSYIPTLQGVSDLNIWTSHSFERVAEALPEERETSEYLSLPGAMSMAEQAGEAFRTGQYQQYFILLKDSWDTALTAYTYVRSKAEGAATTVPFFSLIAVPFTILAEALFFKVSGKKKVISLVMIFSLQIGALYLLHPGFSVAASPIINVVGFSMLILLLPILGIVVGRVSRFMRTIKVKYVGEHQVDISRMRGSFLPSFKLGVENMKRRKVRTSLILVSVMLLVLSVSLFTSISPQQSIVASVIHQEPSYEGILIRKSDWGNGRYDLGERLVEFLEAKYGDNATIAYRVWAYMYGDFRGNLDPILERPLGTYGYKLRSTETGRNVSLDCLWGLTPQEKDMLGLDSLIVSGRWFLDSEASKPVCILPQTIADYAGFKIGDKLTLVGTNFTVIGIIRDDEVGIDFQRDLDQPELGVAPLKMDWGDAPNPWNVHNDHTYYIIVPSKILLRIGGGIASVAMKPSAGISAHTLAREVFDDVSAHLLYSGFGNDTRELSSRLVFTVYGSEFQMIPSALVILGLLNMLLGSIYERKKDIGTFSSVGLSPSHIAVQFMAEAATYAVVGTIIGYLLSLGVMSYFGALLGVSLDYSSLTVLLVIAISMATVMASSLYPALTASRLVTPSLERTWAPPTKASGDAWEVSLPFNIVSDAEASQLINFFKEFLTEHQIPDAETFSVKSFRDEETTDKQRLMKTIHIEMTLAPYDVGVSQRVSLSITRTFEEKMWTIICAMKRLSGLNEDWQRSALKFIDAARKQVLLWKSMPEETKRTFS
ncbi:MAG: M28 family peptidase [Candidatus Bathyarchaeota archaeon]|nr:M28 family peptidase [Candidatus Bathyarchaeota archaeon]